MNRIFKRAFRLGSRIQERFCTHMRTDQLTFTWFLCFDSWRTSPGSCWSTRLGGYGRMSLPVCPGSSSRWTFCCLCPSPRTEPRSRTLTSCSGGSVTSSPGSCPTSSRRSPRLSSWRLRRVLCSNLLSISRGKGQMTEFNLAIRAWRWRMTVFTVSWGTTTHTKPRWIFSTGKVQARSKRGIVTRKSSEASRNSSKASRWSLRASRRISKGPSKRPYPGLQAMAYELTLPIIEWRWIWDSERSVNFGTTRTTRRLIIASATAMQTCGIS